MIYSNMAFNHHRLNNMLALTSVGVALYLLAAPVLPRLVYVWHKESAVTPVLHSPVNSEGKVVEQAPVENRLVIPHIDVDGEVVEGAGVAALEKGIWRRPKTSTPNAGGNTVLVAHRFLYRNGPNTFYNLDKMQVGDSFTLWWEGKKYEYIVGQVYETEPTDLAIEAATTEPRLTLYTCTPLFTADRRLVVVAFPTSL